MILASWDWTCSTYDIQLHHDRWRWQEHQLLHTNLPLLLVLYTQLLQCYPNQLQWENIILPSTAGVLSLHSANSLSGLPTDRRYEWVVIIVLFNLISRKRFICFSYSQNKVINSIRPVYMYNFCIKCYYIF